jgi:hypothetical protein
MSGIPAGSIVHVGGKTVLNRLQDAGLQNPNVPTQTVYETGNDLVVGKILTEADFRFQLTSWDVSTDLMALLHGKFAAMGALISAADAAGTVYKWEDCQFLNVASPWKRDTGTDGGDVEAGVIIPNLFPTALAYRLGVTENAQMQVTLASGAYYMAKGYPMEETAVGDGVATAYVTSEHAMVHRIGGFASTRLRYVFGVMVNGVIQVEGEDYTVTGGAAPEVAPTAVTIHFTVPPPNTAVVKFCYFSPTAHAIPQADNLGTNILPAAVRGRDITILVGTPSTAVPLTGIQSFELQASCNGALQREMGQYDPIGYTQTGVDTTGTVTMEPKNIDTLYSALSVMLGIDVSEVVGYINQHGVPLTAVIHDPTDPATIIKSIYVPDAIFQAPGESARANQVTQFPIRFESQTGVFREIKGQLPPDGLG